ncbi:transglycosylase [Synechococcus sp. Cruz-9H2]|uniref:type IV pilus biogenesis protein EbsA n=1 Tax=unclassified Synechococcus TaxID=2626047 RepID=UPI0020CB7B96|nr:MULTISPECIES: type IV pilus biogenesis protein EbsA [unclassified Synechococcus]MCP9817888.1 transglycosylase [Synechococcus sp. Cruz-9H2]MCP9842612.1 transglycosylase [Synechococcus sp. Edmonson 11F2]MCP9854284.1 transglycosylase [Synechococcus sp. Cruz-9C9]MCP9862020.1 transglycosylase [Synechococcus sp. Cruz-7E5]MCP9868796.1 transglycosylase [Synechococcus sp. Cruz-7B9]
MGLLSFFGATPSHDPGQVALYAPYCDGVLREAWLIQALDQLAIGEIEGIRRLRPDGEHPFLLRWRAGLAPQETSHCELSFPATAELGYSFDLPTYQLVRWLMDLLEHRQPQAFGDPQLDLPEAFWRWLLLGESPQTSGA